jgi:hypothetical protein
MKDDGLQAALEPDNVMGRSLSPFKIEEKFIKFAAGVRATFELTARQKIAILFSEPAPSDIVRPEK